MADRTSTSKYTRTRYSRRKKDMAKARRKMAIDRAVCSSPWYGNMHQYSKNKIHCSCNLCRFRSAYRPDEKTHSDRMREAAMDRKLSEYPE